MTIVRILRNYHNMGPTMFHGFNQRVYTALSDKSRFTDSFWAGNPGLITSYLTTSKKHDLTYHESLLGSKLVIAEREVLQAQLVLLLDELAAYLDLAAVRTPDMLLASGFDLSKERRGHTRAKANAAIRNAAQAAQDEGETGTPT